MSLDTSNSSCLVNKKSLKMKKGLIRSRNSKKDRQNNDQKKKKRKKHKQLSTKHYAQKIKIEHEPHERSKVKSGSPEGYAAPAPLLTPVVLL
jgi:hypothetical protein